MSKALKGLAISQSYGRLVQVIDGSYYDGLGNLLGSVNPPSKTTINASYSVDNYKSTGVIEHSGLKINEYDDTVYDIIAGVGVITDSGVTTIINIPSATGISPTYIDDYPVTYIAIDINGNIVESHTEFTSKQRKKLIVLGEVLHSEGIITSVNTVICPVDDIHGQMYDLMDAIGPIIKLGKYTINGDNLSINRAKGTIFKAGIGYSIDPRRPHNVDITEEVPLNFSYVYDGFTIEYTNEIDVSSYYLDNNIVSVPSNKFTIQTIYTMYNGNTNIEYGDRLFDTMEDCDEYLKKYTKSINNGILSAFIIVSSDCQSLMDSKNCKIVDYNSNNSSISVNSNLDLVKLKKDLLLDNVNNTKDIDKPISKPTQNAIDKKQDILVSGGNIKTVNGNSLLGEGDLFISNVTDSIHKEEFVFEGDEEQTFTFTKEITNIVTISVNGQELSSTQYSKIDNNKIKILNPLDISDNIIATYNLSIFSATDASIKDRSNHFGTQPISSIDGLEEKLDSKIESKGPKTISGFWTGTREEFDAIPEYERDTNTVYLVTKNKTIE